MKVADLTNPLELIITELWSDCTEGELSADDILKCNLTYFNSIFKHGCLNQMESIAVVKDFPPIALPTYFFPYSPPSKFLHLRCISIFFFI